MKKYLWIPIIIAVAIALAGCVGGGPKPTPTPTPTATPTATPTSTATPTATPTPTPTATPVTSPTPTSTQAVTLTFYISYNDAEMKWLDTVLQEFNQKYPYIKVNLVSVPFFSAATKALSAIMAGINVPDIVRVDPGQVWQLIPYAQELTSLTGKTANQLMSQFISSVRASCVLNGKVYAWPDKVNSVVVYYNKELFKKYGVPFPQFNLTTGKVWTFQQFIQDMKELTHKADNVYGFEMWQTGLWWYLPWIYSNGGDWISSDLTHTILGEEPQAVYQAIAELWTGLAQGYVANGSNPPSDFIHGKIAMIVDGPWDYDYITHALGANNVGLAPIPAGTKGSISNIGGANFVIISKKAWSGAHPMDSYLLVSFITSYQAQKEKFAMLKEIPINLTAYKEALHAPNLSENVKVFFWQVNHAKARPLVGGYSSVEGVFNKYVKKFLQSIVGSGKTVTPSQVQQLFKQIDPLASKYLTTKIPSS